VATPLATTQQRDSRRGQTPPFSERERKKARSKRPFAMAIESGAQPRGHDRIAVRTVAVRLSCVAPSLACIDMPW
jgi:hypothetical protein